MGVMGYHELVGLAAYDWPEAEKAQVAADLQTFQAFRAAETQTPEYQQRLEIAQKASALDIPYAEAAKAVESQRAYQTFRAAETQTPEYQARLQQTQAERAAPTYQTPTYTPGAITSGAALQQVAREFAASRQADAARARQEAILGPLRRPTPSVMEKVTPWLLPAAGVAAAALLAYTFWPSPKSVPVVVQNPGRKKGRHRLTKRRRRRG